MSDADLVRLFHRTERVWAEQLGEAEQLDGGYAVCAADLAAFWAANRVLEAVGIDLTAREPAPAPPPPQGTGRELFAMMRLAADDAERGASAMLHLMEQEQQPSPDTVEFA